MYPHLFFFFLPGASGSEVEPPAPAPARRAGGRRNYIIKGRRYYNVTNEELAYLIARELIDVQREDVKVTFAGKKPHKVSQNAWKELQESLRILGRSTGHSPVDVVEWDDDEEAAMLLL